MSLSSRVWISFSASIKIKVAPLNFSSLMMVANLDVF